MTTLVAERMSASLEGTALERFFSATTVLVPVPGSSIQQPGQLWVPKRIALALVQQGLGAEVKCVLRRTQSVRKSATAAAEDRPRMRDHLMSFAVEGQLDAGVDFVLVDDIVTRGATLMAAATRLREAFPGARVRGFAAMRAMSKPEAFEAIRSPVQGTIFLAESGECFRRP
jgi:predicted amidophosphoribosyltransferase